jgi:hypothetical protein
MAGAAVAAKISQVEQSKMLLARRRQHSKETQVTKGDRICTDGGRNKASDRGLQKSDSLHKKTETVMLLCWGVVEWLVALCISCGLVSWLLAAGMNVWMDVDNGILIVRPVYWR